MTDKEDKNPFQYVDNYPSPTTIFQTFLTPVKQVVGEALFVLDTNTLLAPFSISGHSLEKIRQVYTKLKTENRICIPAHVAREFAQNRTTKLQEIHQQLIRQKGVSVSLNEIPLLSGDDDYSNLLEQKKKLDEEIKSFRNSLDIVLQKVKIWRWDDPVSLMYREIFTSECIHELNMDRKDILEKIAQRNKNAMPPGYKDSSKKENSFGDYIIWETIIEIARIREKNIIFVTNDGKPDWWAQSEGSALYPRFELVHEFNSRTSGREFHILRLSDLLNLLDTDATTVRDIKIAESLTHENSARDSWQSRALDKLNTAIIADLSTQKWSVEVLSGTHNIVARLERSGMVIIPVAIDNRNDFIDKLPKNVNRIEGQLINEGYDNITKVVLAIFKSQSGMAVCYEENDMSFYPSNTNIEYYFWNGQDFTLSLREGAVFDELIDRFVLSLELPF